MFTMTQTVLWVSPPFRRAWGANVLQSVQAPAWATHLHMLDFLDTVVLGDEGGVW